MSLSFPVQINYSQSLTIKYNRDAVFLCPRIILRSRHREFCDLARLGWGVLYRISLLYPYQANCMSVRCLLLLPLFVTTLHDMSTSIENAVVGSGVYRFRSLTVWTSPLCIYMPRSLNPLAEFLILVNPDYCCYYIYKICYIFPT